MDKDQLKDLMTKVNDGSATYEEKALFQKEVAEVTGKLNDLLEDLLNTVKEEKNN